MVKHFIMGRIHAESITKAIDKLGKGVVSIKPCDVQVRDDVTWYEYVREVGGEEDGTLSRSLPKLQKV